MKTRLDKYLGDSGEVFSRSQAESYIRLGKVEVNGKVVTKTGFIVNQFDKVVLKQADQYVGRAGMKLASVSKEFGLNFKDQIVLDVGSSTGGFTDFALKNGAKHVIAVELGTNQLHPSLRGNPRIELHEQTDIRTVKKLTFRPNIIVIDVSFISLREILPYVSKLASKNTQIVAMVKPQFEARNSDVKHSGVIKNEVVRRKILAEFEQWAKQFFYLSKKMDSQVKGEKGNAERFYVLVKL